LRSRKEVIPLAIKYEPAADAAGIQVEDRRSGRIVDWLRELFRLEPVDARRQRIKAEAAAELGLTTPQQPEHTPGR
jgi:hypothetical protein